MAEFNSKTTQNQRENYEFKPCPFCGGKADAIYDDAGKWFYIACVNDECPIIAQGMWHTDMQKAIEEWNTRTPTGGGEK